MSGPCQPKPYNAQFASDLKLPDLHIQKDRMHIIKLHILFSATFKDELHADFK